ncbi:hypothetical protein ENBRE01_1281 [Enteropsectra breve]|nr:hypothetical protein ENBRE01_1281 [Enteropsectra breve]
MECLQNLLKQIKRGERSEILESEMHKLFRFYRLPAVQRALGKSFWPLFYAANTELKYLLLECVRPYAEDFEVNNINVHEYLESNDFFVRKLGRRIVEVFWVFYNKDKVLLFKLRKYRFIKKLIEGRFAKDSMEARVHTECYRIFSCSELSAIHTIKDLKNVLVRKHILHADSTLKNYIENKIESTGNNSGIPGLSCGKQETDAAELQPNALPFAPLNLSLYKEIEFLIKLLVE